jgi:hypothetical protein
MDRRIYLKHFTITCCFVLFIAFTSFGEVKMSDNTSVNFITPERGKQILGTPDEFVKHMSPFDRAARLKTDRNVSEEEYLNFVKENVLPWSQDEQSKIEAALSALRPKFERLNLPFPKVIYMIKTTGKEEGQAAYTRSNAIVFPESVLAYIPEQIQKLICHELFHVLTRGNFKMRERLYNAIGFEKCEEPDFPPLLKSRKITNPDAPLNDHCIQVQLDGKAVWVVPVLFSTMEKYDVKRGGEFFNYLQFQFLIVTKNRNSDNAIPADAGKSPALLKVEQITGFFEQVGRNTGYIIHPEEILADNFTLLVQQVSDPPSPQILKKMRDEFEKNHDAKPDAPEG